MASSRTFREAVSPRRTETSEEIQRPSLGFKRSSDVGSSLECGAKGIAVGPIGMPCSSGVRTGTWEVWERGKVK